MRNISNAMWEALCYVDEIIFHQNSPIIWGKLKLYNQFVWSRVQEKSSKLIKERG